MVFNLSQKGLCKGQKLDNGYEPQDLFFLSTKWWSFQFTVMSLDNPCGAGSARHTRSCSSPLVLSSRRVQRGHGHREARVVSCLWAVGSLPSIREGFRISSPRPERLLAALCSRSPTRLSYGMPCWLGQQCTPGWQRWYTLQPHSTCCAGSTQPAPRRRRRS